MDKLQSIIDIPADLITTHHRAYLLYRAASNDVYAYQNASGWQVFDTDTRIPLYQLDSERWTLTGIAQQADTTRFILQFATCDNLHEDIEVRISTQHDEYHRAYVYRAARVAQMIAADINVHKVEPNYFNGCQY